MLKRLERKRRLTINLMGESGNAYWLLGYASDLCEQLGISKERAKEIQKDMKSCDYNHLVAVFEVNFGEFVTLEADKDLLESIKKEVDKIREEEGSTAFLLNWLTKK